MNTIKVMVGIRKIFIKSNKIVANMIFAAIL
jgi:hypothetical protein